MAETRNIVVALPSGKFFDRLYESLLALAPDHPGTAFSRLDLSAGLGTMCNATEHADFLIADVSGRNPRVMYLAGYAHGIGKRVIFLTQIEEDFPFAGSQQPLVVYSGHLQTLRDGLEKALGHPEEKKKEAPGAPDARQRFLELFGEILRTHAHDHHGPVQMENDSTFILVDQNMELALVQDLSRRARELGIRLKLM